MTNITLHTGETVSIAHVIAQKEIAVPCEEIGRDIRILVTFECHCWTEAYDATVHSEAEIVAWDGGKRGRVFCAERHALSLRLPDLIDQLPTQRVYQTAQQRNYVYVVPLQVDGKHYEIYFVLQRRKVDGFDLRLTVESAYPVTQPSPVRKRPREIRFKILAYKVLANEQVKFAAR